MRKIKLYMEVPTNHLDELHPLIDGHFCIASKCLTDPRYFEWFKNRPKDSKVMLDNGTYEEGAPVSCDELIEIAKAIQPHVVFAPDILFDGYATWDLSVEFYRRSEEMGAFWKVGFIPQGTSTEDLLQSYTVMAQYLLIKDKGDWLALAFGHDRLSLMAAITQQHRSLAPLPHHMLGLQNLDEIKHWPEWAVSMDTVKPLKAAWHGYQMESCPRGLGKWDPGWELSPIGMALTYRNIAVLQKHLTLGGNND